MTTLVFPNAGPDHSVLQLNHDGGECLLPADGSARHQCLLEPREEICLRGVQVSDPIPPDNELQIEHRSSSVESVAPHGMREHICA